MPTNIRIIQWLKVLCLALSVLTAMGSPATDQARIIELRHELARQDDLYYRKAAPEISDAAYDALKAELHRLENTYPDFKHTNTAVGDDRTGGFAKYRHLEPMLSLDKAYSNAELAAFHQAMAARLGHEDIVYRIEPKFDGIAVSLTYENGHLVRAATRGNGAEGDDITDNVRALCAPPEELKAVTEDAGSLPALIEVRGEIYLGQEAFARINREREEAGEPLFANPRNLAAGSVKLLDANALQARHLDLVCYGWGAIEPADARPATLGEFRQRLQAWGLPMVEEPLTAVGWEALLDAIGRMQTARKALGIPTDGVVVKLEAVAEQDQLGLGPAAPRWAIARKFPAERVTTRLKAITWQVGRTGVVTPVAELEPVALSGSTVARASLHNAKEIAALDLRIGDMVWVEKAGEIIPAIMGIDHQQRPADASVYAVPEECPVCGTRLVINEEQAARRCPNYDCVAQVAERVEYFASKSGVDIKGLGPATVVTWVERGWVRSPADLYGLKREQLLGVPGFGERSVDALLAAIAESRGADWPDVLRGLGLPGVGSERARDLAHAVNGLDALIAVDLESLVKPENAGGAGFGNSLARTVLAHLAKPQVQTELKALATAGVGTSVSGGKTLATEGAFSGEVVVLTGTLSRWTRAEATAALEAAGASVEPRVTKRTTLVVAGENPGAKLQQARERGITVLDEAALVARLGLEM